MKKGIGLLLLLSTLAIFSVRIEQSLAAEFEALAKAQGLPVSELQRLAIEDIVCRHKQSKPIRPVTIADLDEKMESILVLIADAENERLKTNILLKHLAGALGLK
jgi:antitoxin component of RelBE/YafQ-DinJ toxin-antitoxin module